MKPCDNAYQRILITGGAGFIGSHLVDDFLRLNRMVYVLDDLSGGTLDCLNLEDSRLVFHKMNLGQISRHPDMMKQLMDIVSNVDIVYHLASPIGVARSHWQRYETTERILSDGLVIVRACTECRTPLVFTSSSEVYGRGGNIPCREVDVSPLGLEPRWGYGTAKLAVEHLVAGLYKEHGIPTWIVRFFNVVGSRQRLETNLVFPVFCSSAIHNKSLIVYGNGAQTRNFLHVRDATAALRIVTTNGTLCGAPVNIGNDNTVTILDLAHMIIKLYHSDSSVRFQEYKTAFGSEFVPVHCRKPDLTRIYQSTDWKPKRSLSDAIMDFKTHVKQDHVYQSGMVG